MRWQRQPRWIQLAHDLAVIDFRLLITRAVRKLSHLTLEDWQHEGVFRSNMDVVEIQIEGKDGKMSKHKKGICPDSYFVITDHQRRERGAAARGRFLLEMDMSTHDNPSFGREKVLPGIAYLLSKTYRERFGDNSGRWLVVTTGERRLMNLKRQAETVAGEGAAVFHFATFAQLKEENVLSAPVWHQAGREEPVALL